MGQEFHRKGVNLLLGPVVGPLGRVAEGGRNWEGFSNDPYLTGALVYETVQGVQSSGVGVSTKVSISHSGKAQHGLWFNSTTSAMSKRQTEIRKRLMVLTLLPFRPTSMTRQFTSFTCGLSRMQSWREVLPSCAHMSGSTTRMLARIARPSTVY